MSSRCWIWSSRRNLPFMFLLAVPQKLSIGGSNSVSEFCWLVSFGIRRLHVVNVHFEQLSWHYKTSISEWRRPS